MSESTSQPLRLGRIPFLHMMPHNEALAGHPALGHVRYTDAPPRELNRLLREGKIDAAPASSIEYAADSANYRLLPDFAVANRLAQPHIRSVLLFLRRPLDDPAELTDRSQIAVTTASAASIALLTLCMREFYGTAPQQTNLPPNAVLAETHCDALLLIGDRALGANPEFASNPTLDPNLWTPIDLGALWTQHTGLPFAFAVYIIRADAVERHRESLELMGPTLASVRPTNEQAQRASADSGWEAEAIQRYWSDLYYRLEEPQREGLGRFYRLAEKYRLIDKAPPLRFF